jgi:hypothetical protein
MSSSFSTDVVDDRADVVHAADGAHVLVVVVVLAQLLEAGVEVADVGGGPGNPLAVQFHHHAEGGVHGRVLGTEIEHPAVRGVHVVLEVVDGFEIDIESLVCFKAVGHGGSASGVVRDR